VVGTGGGPVGPVGPVGGVGALGPPVHAATSAASSQMTRILRLRTCPRIIVHFRCIVPLRYPNSTLDPIFRVLHTCVRQDCALATSSRAAYSPNHILTRCCTADT